MFEDMGNPEVSGLSQSDKATLNDIGALKGVSDPIFLKRISNWATSCSVTFIFSLTVLIITTLFPESYYLAWFSSGIAMAFILSSYNLQSIFHNRLSLSDIRISLIFGLIHFSIYNGEQNLPEYDWFGIPLDLRPLLRHTCLSMLKYSTLLIALLSYCHKVYEKDQASMQFEIKSHLKKTLKKREAKSQQLWLGINHVHLLAEELHTTVNVIQSALRNLSIQTERDTKECTRSSPFSMILDSSFLHIFKICERLLKKDMFEFPESQQIITTGKTSLSTFQLSGLLQEVGDLLVNLASQQKVDLVINDADFAFRKISAYGEGIELHHILHQVVKYAIFSAVPKSSVELGVKIPSPAQAQVDPLHKDSERYPFIFQVSYSANSNIELEASPSSLELIRRQIGAKITHFEGSDRKTIYVHCNLTLPSSSSSLLHQQFDQLLEFHEETKEILNHSMVFISPSHSRFGVYIQSCWQLMGASLKACDCEPSALNKVLRTLSEKSPQSKQVCITINGHFPSFQSVVHDLLLRNTGDMGRRSSSNSFSVIFLVSPSEYKKSTRFLETILSQCHSSFYPCISIILKPIGFRRFASLFVAHAASRSPISLRRPDPNHFVTPPNVSCDTVDSLGSSPRQSFVGAEGDRITIQSRSEANNNSSLENVAAIGLSLKEAVEPIGSPAPLPQVLITPDVSTEKPTFTPLSKLVAKGKHSRPSSKSGKLNAVTKPSRKSRISSLLTPQMARRPGNNSSSYFPQVQSLPINVLIVEDNPINQKILATFMMKRKIKYSVANDGQEAVEKWKEGGFHIVLMDIQLPVMDGIEATKAIRQIERHRQIGFFSPPSTTPQSDPIPIPSISQPNTPSPRTPPTPIQSPVIIVALTASSLRTDRIDALAAGCNDFLTKPVSLVWLEKKIMEWGCMQALIDVEGWRRLKYGKNLVPTSRVTGPSTAPITHSFAASKISEAGSNFNMRSEAMLSKLKKAEEKKRASSPSSSS